MTYHFMIHPPPGDEPVVFCSGADGSPTVPALNPYPSVTAAMFAMKTPSVQ